MTSVFKATRRDFVKAGLLGTGGLVLGIRLPAPAKVDGTADTFQPNAFLRIDADGAATIWFPKTEMGQGIKTALPMLVAEELGVAWHQVTVIQAPGHPERFGSQGTGGSRSIRTTWEPLRKAGAAGREMLLQAAAGRMGVAQDTLTAEAGQVVHAPTGRRIGYGELVDAAAGLAVPTNPPLKDPDDFTILGTPVPRVDTPEKTDGSAVFGMDARVEGMRYATVVHPPTFGASLARMSDTAALAVPGVERVVEVSNGVAVVAANTWGAFQGAKALEVSWNEGYAKSSSDIQAELARLAGSPGAVARSEGDVEAALDSASDSVDAVYEVPYLAHATMEPMNCTVDVQPDRCRVWVPTQSPQGVIRTVERITGLPPDQIEVHLTYLGGGFGRRSNMDFVVDAVETSRAVGGPVQMVWTREEDMRQGNYRPCTYNTFRGVMTGDGRPLAWHNRIVGPSIIASKGGRLRNGIDSSSVEGAANIPYDIPNIQVEYAKADIPVPLHWWRSVGSSQNAFITESFIDEMAHAAGADPFEYRRGLLGKAPRHLGVLELAAAKAGWGNPLPGGRERGIAVAKSFGTYVAQVAEVSVDATGMPRVHRVVCAVDCGHIVNHNTIDAQMQSGIVYGLSAALFGEITLDRGRVVQANFDSYPVVRMNQSPAIEVHIVSSREDPGGIGEPGTPPIAPAVTNALFALTGVRVRRLPIQTALRERTRGEAVGGE